MDGDGGACIVSAACRIGRCQRRDSPSPLVVACAVPHDSEKKGFCRFHAAELKIHAAN
jgi:hypothetical protein